MAYDNNSDATTIIYQKAGSSGAGATISYSSLTLNPLINDSDQIVVIRKFTPTTAYKAAAAPDGFGGTYPDGQEWWDIWTLQDATGSGSTMYTIDDATKNIAVSTQATDYSWTRTNADGTTTDINLPAFSAQTDDVIIMRKTYALDNFVNWMAGTRITSKNLNLNSDQLLHLLQELVSNVRREDLVNPFVGAASGICPLDSAGYISAANVGSGSLAEALAEITFTAGDGLTGGGTLASNRTFSVSLDTSTTNGLSFVDGRLSLGLGTSITTGGGLLTVRAASNGGLTDAGAGLKADAFTTLASVTTATNKLITSSVAKELSDKVDNLGTGVRFLGGFDPQTKASATIIGTAALDDRDGDNMVLRNADGSTVTLHTDPTKNFGDTSSDGGNHIWELNTRDIESGSEVRKATQALYIACKTAIDAGELDMTIAPTTVATIADGTQVNFTLTQTTSGTGGNTTIDSITGVTAPSTFTGGTAPTEEAAPAGGFLAGDTYDILHDGFTAVAGIFQAIGGGELAVTQGHDIRYDAIGTTGWYSVPPVSTVDLSAYFRKDGSTIATGEFNMGGAYKIGAMADPSDNTTTELQYAATKNFVLNKAFALTPLDNMSDVAGYTTPTAKSILVWNFADTDNNWKTKTLATISVGELDDFDMTTAAPATGNVLSWDGSNWTPSSAYGTPQVWSSAGGSITGGTGVAGYGDGSTVSFTLTSQPNSTAISSFIVGLDGAMQVPGLDVTSVTATETTGTITFAVAPPYGTAINVYNTGKVTNLPSGTFVSVDDATPALIAKANSPTQVPPSGGNIQEWQDSSGGVLAAINGVGAFVSGGAASMQILQIATSFNAHAVAEAPYTYTPPGGEWGQDDMVLQHGIVYNDPDTWLPFDGDVAAPYGVTSSSASGTPIQPVRLGSAFKDGLQLLITPKKADSKLVFIFNIATSISPSLYHGISTACFEYFLLKNDPKHAFNYGVSWIDGTHTDLAANFTNQDTRGRSMPEALYNNSAILGAYDNTPESLPHKMWNPSWRFSQPMRHEGNGSNDTDKFNQMNNFIYVDNSTERALEETRYSLGTRIMGRHMSQGGFLIGSEALSSITCIEIG